MYLELVNIFHKFMLIIRSWTEHKQHEIAERNSHVILMPISAAIRLSHDMLVISAVQTSCSMSSLTPTSGMDTENYPYYFEKLTAEEEDTVRTHFLSRSKCRDLGK